MENPIVEQVAISQNQGGYRYSVEPFLLAHWVHPTGGSRVLDIGTGCGVISLLLMSRQADLAITAVELQKSLYQSAVDNVEANGWSNRIRMVEGDFQTVASDLEPESFDWILSNPPYRRHELALTLETLVATSVPLLKPGGKIALAYPFYRLEEVMDQLRKVQLHPTRFVRVFGHEGGSDQGGGSSNTCRTNIDHLSSRWQLHANHAGNLCFL
jgi:tRNA1Val (adenine37-N6)-methyltransferase